MSPAKRRPKSSRSYRGKLTISEVASGIESAYHSAEAAYGAAVASHQAGQDRAAALAYLDVIQEVGRRHSLRGMAAIHPRDQKAWKESWSRQRRHDFRIAYALGDAQRALGGLKDIRGFVREIFEIAISYAPSYEVFRKHMNYTDFDPESRQWLSSLEPTAEELDQLSAIAGLVFGRATALRSLGLLKEEALQVVHEELASLHFEFRRKFLGDPKSMLGMTLSRETVTAWQCCWRRFNEELGIDPDQAEALLGPIS